MIFPDITAPIKESKISTKTSLLKKEYDSNYTQVRPRSTRSRKMFSMVYILEGAEMDTLRSFFEDNTGVVFTYTHPYKGTTHEVFFEGEDLEEEILSYNVFKVQVSMQEV